MKNNSIPDAVKPSRSRRKPKGIIPPMLTKNEEKILANRIYMNDWHFDKLFKPNCTEIQDSVMNYEKDDNGKTKYLSIHLMGLNAMNANTKQRCFDNFFIRFGHRVLQSWSIESALVIVRILKKEYLRDEYEERMDNEKCERQVQKEKLLNATKKLSNEKK